MNDFRSIAKEQVMEPMDKLKAPRKKKAAMKHDEKKETPSQEATAHDPRFLKTAAKMAGAKC